MRLAIVFAGAAIAALTRWPGPHCDADEPSSARNGAPPGEAVFDPDPAHPWNRLHRTLYLREMGEGRTYAHDTLEAPFGREGPFLVEGPSHTRTVSVGRTTGPPGWRRARPTQALHSLPRDREAATHSLLRLNVSTVQLLPGGATKSS